MTEYYKNAMQKHGVYIYLLQDNYTGKSEDTFGLPRRVTAMSYFNAYYDSAILGTGRRGSNLLYKTKQSQLNAIKELNKDNDIPVRQMKQIMQALGKDENLQYILKGTTDAIDAAMKSVTNAQNLSEFNKLKQASYGALLGTFDRMRKDSTRRINEVDIRKFFNALMEAQVEIEGPQGLQALELLYQLSIDGRSGASAIKTIPPEVLDRGGALAKLIASAIENNKFLQVGQGGKEVHVQTLLSILSNYFGLMAGEEIVKDYFNEDLIPYLKQTGKDLIEGLSVSKNTSRASRTIETTTKTGKGFKPDIFVSNLFTFNAQKLGQGNYEVSLHTSISNKWYNKADFKKWQGWVKLAEPKLTTLLPAKTPLSAAGDIIAHEGTGSDAYSVMRNGIASRFFVDWLMGTGDYNNEGFFNSAQYLMINGKIFSTMDIAQKAVQEYLKGGVAQKAINAPIKISLSNVAKVKSANKNYASNYQGYNAQEVNTRISELKKLLSDITLLAELNINFLRSLDYN